MNSPSLSTTKLIGVQTLPLPTKPSSFVMRAPSVLLMGPTGTGKTHSLLTLVEAGLELFVIVTEPNGVETLLDAALAKKLPIDRIHFRVIEPARAGFAGLEAMATNVSKFNFDALSKMSPTSRADAAFITLLATMRNFTCDHCGRNFGGVSNFSPDCAVAVDSLSGLNLMAMDCTIGDKVTAHVGEWGIAMGLLGKFILECTSNLKALFVLTAHIDREQDEITGGTKIMAAALGRKLAPQIPRFFSEVVLTSVEGPDFYWNTSASSIDLKKRNLPLGSKLKPTFEPVVTAYKKRLETMSKAT